MKISCLIPLISLLFLSLPIFAQTKTEAPTSPPSPSFLTFSTESPQASTTTPSAPTLDSLSQEIEKLKNDVSAAIQNVPTTTVPPVLSSTSTVSKTSSPLPQNFAGAGAAYNPSGSPKTTGWASWGKLIDPKSESYFFTTEDAILVRAPSYTVQTSVRVGVATLLKQLGPVKIYGIVDGGGATTGLSTGGAVSGGGIGQIPIGKSHYHFALGFRILKATTSGGTPKMYEVGFFKDF